MLREIEPHHYWEERWEYCTEVEWEGGIPAGGKRKMAPRAVEAVEDISDFRWFCRADYS